MHFSRGKKFSSFRLYIGMEYKAGGAEEKQHECRFRFWAAFGTKDTEAAGFAPANISEPDLVKFGVTQKVTILFKAALRGGCCYFQYRETGKQSEAFDASPYKMTMRRQHL